MTTLLEHHWRSSLTLPALPPLPPLKVDHCQYVNSFSQNNFETGAGVPKMLLEVWITVFLRLSVFSFLVFAKKKYKLTPFKGES